MPLAGRPSSRPLLEMNSITKSYPGVRANDRVSLQVQPGEIHALLGENGAGKTTLMNVLYGLCQPDEGVIRVRGERVRFESPRDAIRHGIGMVHQHFTLVPTLTVAENVALGVSGNRAARLDVKTVAQEIFVISQTYGLAVDPRALVGDLSLGAQQRVEIIKALRRSADLLVLDEPTSILTPGEVQQLFAVLRQLKAEGRSVIFISHKLAEIREISDRVTVLRDGRVVGRVPTASADVKMLAKMMVGREVTLQFPRTSFDCDEKVLEVIDLQVSGHPGVRGLSFTVHRGEIFGIAGVDGNGQTELARAIAGLVRPDNGDVLLQGTSVSPLTVRQRKERGLAYVPEDRRGVGLVPELSIAENLVLRDVRRRPFARWGFLSSATIRGRARELCRAYGIKAPTVLTKAHSLSGGNQQRVVLAREISRRVSVLLVVHPTLGLDVGAAQYVLRTMLKLRQQGAAILYISSELEEILAISDRIGVMFQGELVGVVRGEDAEVEHVGLMMSGASNGPAVASSGSRTDE